MGLSPDAPEDEAGIKKAAENSKAPALPLRSLPFPLPKAPGSAHLLPSSLLQSPSPGHTLPPSQGFD